MTTKTIPNSYLIQAARNIASGEVGLAGHVINSLCDDWEALTKKVAELEAALNPAPIGKETLLLRRDDLLQHLFIEAFAATFLKDTENTDFKNLIKATELRLVLLANDVPHDNCFDKFNPCLKAEDFSFRLKFRQDSGFTSRFVTHRRQSHGHHLYSRNER